LQQVGVYLANKYGLPTNLAPVISPAAGFYSSAQTISISSGLSTGTIHYTIDGTDPTAASPTYTGSFSLSGSALVSAAVFINGNLASPVASSQFYINDTGNTGLPPAPTGLSVSAVSDSEIDLSWSLASLQTYSQVYVYRSTNGGAYELVGVLSSNATSFADTNVTPGNSYTYEVGTLNQAGVSATSASSSVSPTAVPTLTITVTTPSGAVPLP
jgi:Chitobiase/beta-hexosaminidase C-terminal domain/Fibronectin type III domain